ncbi:MAG TPA: 7,8-didemethyl-8-hydroxy-5-deazariboflavin synthase subunit CofG [Stenomitos sp.]
MVAFNVATYSPAFTLVPTYECFNRCAYCNFRTDPAQSPWLTLADATRQLQQLPAGVSEILILSGEVHPRSVRRTEWFRHIYQLCELSLSLGFLPHSNVGPLSWAEMTQLKQVNVSMGLMLEQTTPSLLETVHRDAPSKRPELRLQQLDWAGALKIPFTTGLLLGLGESEADRWETLEAIARSHRQWGHIQEVILQPYSPGHQDNYSEKPFGSEDLIAVVAAARQLLPPEITIQIPPNLMLSPQTLLDCLSAGARDLGGIVPHDHVNPNYDHQDTGQLEQWLASRGWHLQPRLPLYPQFDAWVAPPLQDLVQRWRDRLGARYTDHQPSVSPKS